MSIKVDLTGINELLKDLKKVGASGVLIVDETVNDIAISTHKAAIDGILGGPATGAVYKKYNPKRTHKASAPGEYPASDTGHLAGNIKIDYSDTTDDKPLLYVGTKVKYGAALEFGTPKMAARPWLMRSFEMAKSSAIKGLKQQFESLVKK